MTNFCESCGHPLPDDSVLAALTPLQREMFSVIKRAGRNGITSKELIDIVYANYANGGPKSNNIVPVIVRQINFRIEKFDFFIKGRRGPGGYFTLEKFPPQTYNNKYMAVKEIDRSNVNVKNMMDEALK